MTDLGCVGESFLHTSTTTALPGNVLLEIFDFYRNNHDYTCHGVWKWHLLVHVCQRWRQVVFTSPHRLKLQLLCTFGTPVRKNLGIWPPLPVLVDCGSYSGSPLTPNEEDNVIAALEHHNRVCRVNIYLTSPQLGKVVAAMQEPYPVLRYLSVGLRGGNARALPTGFLGGCAPGLQVVTLSGIAYPALPSLLLRSKSTRLNSSHRR